MGNQILFQHLSLIFNAQSTKESIKSTSKNKVWRKINTITIIRIKLKFSFHILSCLFFSIQNHTLLLDSNNEHEQYE